MFVLSILTHLLSSLQNYLLNLQQHNPIEKPLNPKKYDPLSNPTLNLQGNISNMNVLSILIISWSSLQNYLLNLQQH